MITRIDIRDALSMLVANAPDKTPDVGEMTERAWIDYFDAHPRWTGDDLVAATHEYCKQPRERLVQPADLGEIISSWYQDRLARMDPGERTSAYEDLGGGIAPPQRTPKDRYNYVDKSAPEWPDYPADWTPEQRLKESWRRTRNNERPPQAPPEPPAGYGSAPDEHPPGEPCADQMCDAPSTFGPYCAKHFCLSLAAKVGIVP